MSTAASPSSELSVLNANNAFYRALQSMDLRKMEAVWWHEDWVRCLHPGWDLLLGWEAVRESWALIFNSTSKMRVAISRPLIHVAGDTAWISCVEHVTSTSDEDFLSSLVEATNIFVRRNGEWRMVHHHATPLPERSSAGATDKVQ
jgi:ketosteroid isomerase-like protein